MILLILGKTYCKFLINILCISRTKCKFQIYTSSGYTIQFQIIFKCYIFIFYFICTKVLDLSDRLLDQTAIFNRKFSRNTHLSEPFSLRNPVIAAGIPVLHPADHDPSSVRRFYSLHCIEINSVIYSLITLRNESFRSLIEFTDQTKCSISVMIFKVFRKHILRAYQHNILSIQSKEVRALPHLSESSIIGKHDGFKLPVISILTSVQQNTSACSICSVIYSYTAVRSILAFPHLRITEIKWTAVLRHIFYCKDRISRIFFIIRSITRSKTLSLDVTDTAARLNFFAHTCVHKELFTVRKLYSTSGETSHIIVRHVRCNS